MDLSRNLSKFPAKVSPLNDFHKAFEILDNFSLRVFVWMYRLRKMIIFHWQAIFFGLETR